MYTNPGYQIDNCGGKIMSLGERLRDVRRLRGKTQEQVSEAVGVTEAALSRYENDLRKPDPDMLKKLARVLSASIDYLLGMTDEVNPLPAGKDPLAKKWPLLTPERRKRAAEYRVRLVLSICTAGPRP